MEATIKQLAAAFAEWDRRVKEDPGAFADIDDLTCKEYGGASAQYFIKIIEDVKAGRV